ncbi:MAG TPA: Ldh family oxidoreductase [Candidatus Saccharimonadales bacterium]|nr:Ldh family oxidoreductase [Candidatus Saccharimonadales bacterium]
MIIKLDELKSKVLAGVQKLGYSGEDAQIISEVLLYAQVRGNNQGITKIATGGVPKASEVEELKVVKENKCGALMSGGHSMVASAKAAQKAVELAQEHGVGVVCTNHNSTSSGAIGYFSRLIAKQGMIGFVCVGNGQFKFVAPAGSSEPKMGTNPFTYAFPYTGGEVVFDNATSAIAFFGIVEAKLKGEQLPEGVGFDKNGNPTTDPAQVMDDGSIATFANHKGFGLSLFVQLLGSAVSLAGFPGSYAEDGQGTFVLALDPGLLAGKDEYMKRATELVEYVKSAKPLPGKKVLLPGEHGDAIAKRAEESGEIEVADAIWNELVAFVGNS